VDVLIVDDYSGDGTPDWTKAQPEYDQKLFLIQRPGKQGLGSAYFQAFGWALEKNYDYIVQMDADLSHDPHQIPELIDLARNGADLVLASRYLQGVRILNWPLRRLLLSKCASLYVRAFTGMPVTDPTGGFKCWRRELLKRFDFGWIRSTGYGFQIEMSFIAWKLGARIVEVATIFEGRHAGSSKMSPDIAREAFWLVLRLAFSGGVVRRRHIK
jgi:dolichol-phosphate mannosyltransferase